MMVRYKLNKNSLSWIDYFIFSIMILSTFLLFTQTDVIVTGNHALLLLEGSPFDFYTRCYDFMGSYSANYFPSTFIVYAVWNIPIKLLGAVAHTVETTPLWQIYWYKLFPCVIYITCTRLVYQLCRQLKFGDIKAHFVAYAFMTAPLAFFSQFIFFQYDIFTVFFMLLGLRFYFSESNTYREMILFCLCFGVAVTFKYHVLLFFLVLLFLKVKEIPKLIGYSALSGLPIIIEFLFYYIFDRESFLHAVLGFSALEYAAGKGIEIGFSSVSLIALCACILLAWSYFTEPQTERERVCDAFFFCSGMCVVLFGLMTWHPQWLLLGVLFWTISACISKYCDTFLWLDMLEIAVFYILITVKFAGNVDQSMLSHGIFREWLFHKDLDSAIMMKDIFRAQYIDESLLYSVFLAILLVQFLFTHRKYCQEEIGHQTGSVWLLRLRLWCGVLLFVVPALLCLPDMLAQKTILEDSREKLSAEYTVALEEGEIIQELPDDISPSSISKVQLFTGTFGQDLDSTTLSLQIKETESDAVIAEAQVSNGQIMENTYTDFFFDDVELKQDCSYQLVLSVASSDAGENVAVYYYEEDSWLSQEEGAEGFRLHIGEEEMQSSLAMRIMGTPRL